MSFAFHPTTTLTSFIVFVITSGLFFAVVLYYFSFSMSITCAWRRHKFDPDGSVGNYIKALPEYFEALWDRRKTFEFRKDDRGYKAGNTYHVCEWTEESGYTGRYIEVQITYVLCLNEFDLFRFDANKLDSQWVIWSFREIRRYESSPIAKAQK